MTDLTNKKKITIMIAIMVAMFFAAINQTIIGVAMPRIIAKLGGMDYYTWAITIYLLTTTVATILVGKLSDIYGRKPFILAGIGFFMVGSLLSGFSQNIFQLISYRAISGLGAGIIMSTAFSAIGDLYAPRERAKWTGLMSGIFGISSVLGPLAGGFIVDHLNWRWVFWIFLPLGIVAFFMILRLFPKTARKAGESIDYLGSLFLTTTLVPLLLAFSWAGDGPGKYAWTSWHVLGSFGIALISLGLFMYAETKAKSPVLPLSLFKNPIVTVSNLSGFLLGAGMLGVMIYVPFFIQGVKGVSPSGSGYIMMPMSIIMVFATAMSGSLISKTGKYKKLAISGLAITTVGIGLLYFLKESSSIYLIILFLAVVGIGLGASMPVFSLTVQNAVSPRQLGVATASTQLFRSLGSTIGIAVLGSVMGSRMTSEMKDTFASGGTSDLAQLPPETAGEFSKLANPEILLDQPRLTQTISDIPIQLQPAAEQLVATVKDVFSNALTTTFLTGAIIMLLAVIVTFFLKEIPLVSERNFGNKNKEKKDESELHAQSQTAE